MNITRRHITTTMAAAIAVASALSLSACGTDESAATMYVVTTATANEPAPAGTAAFGDYLHDAVQTGEGTLQILVPRNGTVAAQGNATDVVVMRGSDPEEDPNEIDKGLKPIVAGIDKQLTSVASNAQTLDLLAGLNDAAHRSERSTIVAVSSGLQTEGLADFRGLGWDFDNSTVINSLADKGFLPDLSGKRVRFVGLGQVAGEQQPLPEPMRRKVIAFWTDLCKAAHATTCESVPEKAAPRPSASTRHADTVRVPAFELPTLTASTTQLAVDSSALFAPDSAQLLPGVTDTMAQLAGQLNRTGVPVTITGHTWKFGPADGARELSKERAQAVADALTSGGLSPNRIADVRGVGYDELITPPGAGPDQTAAANRVVVIGLQR